MSLQDQLRILYEGLVAIDSSVGCYHYYAPSAADPPYIVWYEESEDTSFDSHNHKVRQSVSGYVETPSKRFNNQVPTGMLMQCINYGTEFRQGTHTVDHAIKGVRAKVEKAVQNYIDDKTKEIIS